jgi:hypothetical protein
MADTLSATYSSIPVRWRCQISKKWPIYGYLLSVAVHCHPAPSASRDITVHGFRSTFRDWAAERTNFPNEVVEMALAHTVGDKVEAAYRRGDLFDKRRGLMAEWAIHCSASGASTREKVIPIRRSQSMGAEPRRRRLTRSASPTGR